MKEKSLDYLVNDSTKIISQIEDEVGDDCDDNPAYSTDQRGSRCTSKHSDLWVEASVENEGETRS